MDYLGFYFFIIIQGPLNLKINHIFDYYYLYSLKNLNKYEFFIGKL